MRVGIYIYSDNYFSSYILSYVTQWISELKVASSKMYIY